MHGQRAGIIEDIAEQMKQGRLHPEEATREKARENNGPMRKADGQDCLKHRLEK